MVIISSLEEDGSNENNPKVHTLDSKEDFDSFVTNDINEVVVIGFFKDSNSIEALAFKDAAEAVNDVRFGITSNNDLMEKIKTKNLIILIKSFDEGMNKFDGEITVENVTQFVRTYSHPLIAEFDPEKGFETPINLLLLVSPHSDKFDEMMRTTTEVAKDIREDIVRFVHVNPDEEKNQRVLKTLEVKSEEVPTYRLTVFKGRLIKYKPDTPDFSPPNLKKFISDVKSGQTKPHLNTEEVPSDWAENYVKILVGSNFNEVALEPSKHVVVMFYVPWIKDCAKLEKIWDDLAEAFKLEETLVFAKIDMTRNQVENIQVSSEEV